MIVTVVPPVAGPDWRATAVTLGAGTNVYLSLVLVALVPPVAVTVTSTVAGRSGGGDRGDLAGAVDREAGSRRSRRSSPR